MKGILAVWNDCSAGMEAEYERWYKTEHLPERLGVPGFIAGYRYEAIEAPRQYFTYYETESPQVLGSPAYLERLENPTGLTRAIMPSFTRASRTVCTLSSRFGDIVGAKAVTFHWHDTREDLSILATQIVEQPGVTRAQIWTASAAQTPQTTEARSRGTQDELIAGALIVDCLRESDVRWVTAQLTPDPRLAGAQVGIYSFLCLLGANR